VILPLKCCRGAARKLFLGFLGVLVTIPPCEGICGHQCPLNPLSLLILFKEKNQGDFSSRGLWSRAEGSKRVLPVNATQADGAMSSQRSISLAAGGERMGTDGGGSLGLLPCLPACAEGQASTPQRSPLPPGPPFGAWQPWPSGQQPAPASPPGDAGEPCLHHLEPEHNAAQAEGPEPGREQPGLWVGSGARDVALNSLWPVCCSPKAGEEVPALSAGYQRPTPSAGIGGLCPGREADHLLG